MDTGIVVVERPINYMPNERKLNHRLGHLILIY